MVTEVPPTNWRRSIACWNNCSASRSPKNSSLSGTPKWKSADGAGQRSIGDGRREYGSLSSNPAATAMTAAASSTVSAKIETQSSDRHAGTTPFVLSSPRVGLKPMVFVNPAGTRPDPAVSVPSAKLTNPAATAKAEPELDPPTMYSGLNGFLHLPYGDRVPTSPVAN